MMSLLGNVGESESDPNGWRQGHRRAVILNVPDSPGAVSSVLPRQRTPLSAQV